MLRAWLAITVFTVSPRNWFSLAASSSAVLQREKSVVTLEENNPHLLRAFMREWPHCGHSTILALQSLQMR